MKIDLITSLYVFMLAAFIGFEVIRRVSPLLHTPLMSLTNALDAIAVVGAIILAGERQEHAGDGPRHDRDRRRHEQRRGRIPDHRPHAQDVQGERPEETMTAMIGSEHVIEIAYLVATALFILSLEVDELADARRGAASGPASWGCCWPSSGRCCTTGSSTTRGSPSRWCWARSSACPLGLVQMTAVPQRTALSHAFGALCVTLVGTAEYYLQAPERPAVHDGGAGAGGHPRLAHVHGQPDGRRQAAGDPAAAADHLQGAEHRQPRRCWRWPSASAGVPGLSSRRRPGSSR